MGDNRDLTYQDFRHIIDDISVYRSGSNNDRSLWEERAKRIHGVQLQIETFQDGLDETCRTVFYPQDHPFFLDPNSRPQAPDFSIIKNLSCRSSLRKLPTSATSFGPTSQPRFRNGKFSALPLCDTSLFEMYRAFLRTLTLSLSGLTGKVCQPITLVLSSSSSRGRSCLFNPLKASSFSRMWQTLSSRGQREPNSRHFGRRPNQELRLVMSGITLR